MKSLIASHMNIIWENVMKISHLIYHINVQSILKGDFPLLSLKKIIWEINDLPDPQIKQKWWICSIFLK